MRKLISLIILFCSILSIAIGQERQQRKKVGLVLGGGAAKGFAHIGVLKVLEEAGIPIDYIAGTSMGAVVGGLYALGYSANEIDSLIQCQDWNYLIRDDVQRDNIPAAQKDRLSRYIVSIPYKVKFEERRGRLQLPQGVYTGQNIYSLLLNLTIGYHHEMDFGNLPIPFGCVAADIRTGKEVVIKNGILPEAMRTSMAIPGLFTPIERESMLLIDGGIINNFPVDLVREMGADIVIGVNFPFEEIAIEENRGSIGEISKQLWHFIGQEKRSSNLEDTDLLISPIIHPYGVMDFYLPAIDSIILRGEKYAKEKWDEILDIKKMIGGESIAPKRVYTPYINVDSFRIKEVKIEGINRNELPHILNCIKACDDGVTRKDLGKMVSKLYGTGWFSRVYYRLEGEEPFDLIFSVEIKKTNQLNLGMHFNSEELATLIANTTIQFHRSLNSMFDITTRLSANPCLMVDYSINRALFYRGGINYKLSRNNINFYDKGEIAYNLGVTSNRLTLNFSEFYFGNLKLHFGAMGEYFHYFKALRQAYDNSISSSKDQFFINYLFEGWYDNLNKIYFPRSGQLFSFDYSLHTDNFINLNGNTPLSIVKVNYLKPLRILQKLYITPHITARYIVNDEAPFIYRNVAGGRIDSYYLPQQVALQGSAGMEVLNNLMLVADVTTDFNFKLNHYLYANLNFTNHSDTFKSFLQGDCFFGVNLGYSYLTTVGPLRAELGYSDLSRRLHPYLSFGYIF